MKAKQQLLLDHHLPSEVEQLYRCNACQISLTPSVTDELVNEKEKYKNIADEMDQAFSELSGF